MALGNNSEATVQMSHQTNPARVNLQTSEPTLLVKSPPPQKKSSAGLIIGIFAILFLLVIAIVGAIGTYFMFGYKNDIASVTPTPTAMPISANVSNNSSSTDNSSVSTKELEEKLKRLENQLEEQKKANQTNSSPNQKPNQSGYATAKVNSPNDGFLALRSDPNTETGTQIMKIPHGSIVILNNCEKTTVKVGGRVGRWCDVEYKGQSGWVFSAWLDY
jgi:uncharacterized protein HemX